MKGGKVKLKKRRVDRLEDDTHHPSQWWEGMKERPREGDSDVLLEFRAWIDESLDRKSTRLNSSHL